MNPFQAIPATVRKWLYLAYGVAGLVPTSTAAYYVAVGESVPRWTVGVAAALGALVPLFGATAGANVEDPAKSAADTNVPRVTD